MARVMKPAICDWLKRCGGLAVPNGADVAHAFQYIPKNYNLGQPVLSFRKLIFSLCFLCRRGYTCAFRFLFFDARVPFTPCVSPNNSMYEPVFWTFIIIHLLLYPASNGYNSYFDKD